MLQVVATATLAAYVGAGGLGGYFFLGLKTQDYAEMLGASILVIALAIAFEIVFAVLQRAAVPKGHRATRRPDSVRGRVSEPAIHSRKEIPRDHSTQDPRRCRRRDGAWASSPPSPGCASSDPLDSGSSDSSDSKTIVVGSQQYYSNEIIAELYAQVLEKDGFDVKRNFNIGQREVYIPQLEKGAIDVMPEYSGNLLQYFDKDSDAKTADRDRRRRSTRPCRRASGSSTRPRRPTRTATPSRRSSPRTTTSRAWPT